WRQPVVAAASAEMRSREAAVTAFLAQASPPVAMVAYDDLTAVAALRAAHRARWPWSPCWPGLCLPGMATARRAGLCSTASWWYASRRPRQSRVHDLKGPQDERWPAGLDTVRQPVPPRGDRCRPHGPHAPGRDQRVSAGRDRWRGGARSGDRGEGG